MLVSFGDSIAFEDTLDAALDKLFGGDSGADAGDTDVPDDGDDSARRRHHDAAGRRDDDTSDTGNAALQQALADYQAALADRTAAYQAGDLVAAAEADKRMLDAVQRAIDASNNRWSSEAETTRPATW